MFVWYCPSYVYFQSSSFLSENEVCSDVSNHAAIISEIIDIDFTKAQIQRRCMVGKSAKNLQAMLYLSLWRYESPGMMKRQCPFGNRWILPWPWVNIDSTRRSTNAVHYVLQVRVLSSKPVCLVYDQIMMKHCQGLGVLLNRLEMLCIDTYNKQICQIAPAIKKHGIGHERNKFPSSGHEKFSILNLHLLFSSIFSETLRLDIHHLLDFQKEPKYQVYQWSCSLCT